MRSIVGVMMFLVAPWLASLPYVSVVKSLNIFSLSFCLPADEQLKLLKLFDRQSGEP
jgi:hypothetical protein